MNETKKVSRRKYTAEFRAKIALEAMQENHTLPELCSKYLLKGLAIDHVNQMCELDISHIPMRRSFIYLFAIIDVHSHYVVAWSLSNTMTAEWCRSVVADAIAAHGCPEIINSD